MEYLNALGRMKDRHTVIATFKTGEVTKRVKFEEMGSKVCLDGLLSKLARSA